MDGRRVAVLMHGSGSDPAFIHSAFAPSDLNVDVVVAPSVRSGDVRSVEASLADAVQEQRAQGHEVVLCGGVSLGAHAAARWAAAGGLINRLLLALPAWTGEPAEVAEITRAAAAEVRSLGSAAILDRLAAGGGDWVVDALAAAWPGYGDTVLAAALEDCGSSPGPTETMLRGLEPPCAIVALENDPLHPADVARHWAGLIPRAELRSLPRDLSGRGPSALGIAAGEALAAL